MVTPVRTALLDLDLLASPLLLVDDHPINLRLLELTLRRAGYQQVFCTADPFAVVDLIQELGPALILLDLQMPGRGGLEILDDLRAATPHGALPVLVLTSDTTPETRKRALARGALAVLTKPFDRLDLLHYVGTLLQVSLPAHQGRAQPARPAGHTPAEG